MGKRVPALTNQALILFIVTSRPLPQHFYRAIDQP